jgi:hypothetical protein
MKYKKVKKSFIKTIHNYLHVVNPHAHAFFQTIIFIKNPSMMHGGCIDGWGTTIGTMTPICPMSWVLKQGLNKMNVLRCYNERGICMVMLSTNKCYNKWFKSIEQILNVLFKYKPKRNAWLFRHSTMTYFHLECQNCLKNIFYFLFFLAPTFLILISKPLECKFEINKINLIVLVNASFLWKNPRI